jgi:hypothetical protein
MTKDEALRLALEAMEMFCEHGAILRPIETRDAIKAALEAKDELKCNLHPKAPHGFNRNASHSADRYVCECEGWDAYDAGYQAGIEDTYKRMDEPQQEAKDEPDHSDELTIAYMSGLHRGKEVAQRTWVGLFDTDEGVSEIAALSFTDKFAFARAIEAKLKEKNNG